MIRQGQQSPNTLKSAQSEILRAKRRLQKLEKKTKHQKQSTNRHKSLANEIIRKKIAMAQSYVQAQKEKQELAEREARRMHNLKQMNAQKRTKHTNQLNNIMKAIYLVKMDDARELRRISKQHSMKMNQLNSSVAKINQIKRNKIKSEGGKKQQQYWKQKLYKLYLQNNVQRMNSQKSAKMKQKELENLENRQAELMKKLEQSQTLYEQSKNQYFAAMSLPIRQVAQVMQEKSFKSQLGNYEENTSEPNEVSMKYSQSERISRVKTKKQNGLLFTPSKKPEYKQKSDLLNPESISLLEQFQQQAHFPKTQVNETKLKIVLQKLRNKNKK